jgi:hypothetical protein
MIRTPHLAGTMAAAAALLAGCSSGNSPATAPATAALSSVAPAPAAIAVAPATAITLTFSQPMMAGMEQYVDLHHGGFGDPVVPMSCGWNGDRTVLTCTPGSPLASGTQYTIHVGAGMTDDHGDMMDLDNWTGMGGQWATGGMMGGGMHAGQPVGMMGQGWTQGTHYGMLFTFTTA